LLLQADTAMRTLLPFSGQPSRPSPAIIQPDADLDEQQSPPRCRPDAHQPHR
jgi:ubiquinone biosynthesis monooxygenase Coq7